MFGVLRMKSAPRRIQVHLRTWLSFLYDICHRRRPPPDHQCPCIAISLDLTPRHTPAKSAGGGEGAAHGCGVDSAAIWCVLFCSVCFVHISYYRARKNRTPRPLQNHLRYKLRKAASALQARTQKRHTSRCIFNALRQFSFLSHVLAPHTRKRIRMCPKSTSHTPSSK